MFGRIHHSPQPSRLPVSLAPAYCAGLLDGEGCIQIVKQKKATARRGHIFRLRVDISQNHLGTLIDFQNLIGLPGRIYQVRRTQSQNRDSYVLIYTDAQALAVIQAIKPYLLRKQAEARVAVDFMTTCHIQRHFGPHGCPEPIWQRRERLYQKMQKLK